MLEQYRLLKLSGENNTSAFDCGDNDLNDFIRNDAWKYQQELLSVTYSFLNKNDEIAAFFSVSNDSLKDQDFERWNNLSRKLPNRKRRKDYPAVKIGRLGVNSGYRGIGSEIIVFIKNWFTIENKSGCRFVLVDAYNKIDVLNFYEKNDFIFLTEKDKDKKTRLMYFDLIRMTPK